MSPILVGRLRNDSMASVTIDKREKANGDFSYRCAVRVKKNGVIIHNEAKSFSKKELAKTWGKIQKEAAELNSIVKQDKVISIGELLDLYFNDPAVFCPFKQLVSFS